MIVRSNKMAEDEVDLEYNLEDTATALIVTNLSLEFFDDGSQKV